MAGPLHLAGRFLGSIRPGPPRPSDEAWAVDRLLAGERRLWARMSNPDRRHAIAVAQEVVRRWPELARPGAVGGAGPAVPPRPVVAAALLHDVGKIDSALRTPARVVATLLWAVADDATALRWSAGASPGPLSRLARYRLHPEIGGRLLRDAGADPMTALWAEQHHLRPESWTLEQDVARLLKECDDD